MSAETEGNGDGTNEIHYPSPSAEGIDAGPFYNANSRDGLDQQDQPDQHVPEQVQVKEDHGELHQPEPATPQQHASRPPNIEELQLAAQLGQGLAGTPLMPAADPNMNVEDPNLRNIMPHPEPEQQPQQQQQQPQHHEQHHEQHQQTPSYLHDTPTSDSMIAHGLPVSVGAHLPPHYAIAPDSIPPRKRSKVSRACDECRRKKIKCDAQSDTGEAPCSSCARSNIRCLFSRVPQKRGPSKGYIKELADRIHSIENKLESEGGLTQDDLSGLFGDRSRHSNGVDDSRKRPYSSISGGDLHSPQSARQTPWGSEPRPIQPATENHAAPPYDPASLAPQPSPIKTDSIPRPPVAHMDVSMADVEIPDVDEGVLQDYLVTLQTLYPILPSSSARLQGLLTECPSSVRTAFVHALLAVAQSSSGNVKLANSLLSDWENDESPRTQAINMVHAQALLLLAIDADWRRSPTVSSILGRAVVLANSMGLWKLPTILPESDVDSDDNLCVRIWWSLVLMDRWHAVGSGKPVLIPDASVVVPHGLATVVGDQCCYLVRLSKCMNRVAEVVSMLQPGASTTDAMNARYLNDYVQDYREDILPQVEPTSYPLVHLGYWHCRLLVMLLAPEATQAEILWPTKELINLLSANADMRNPLANHFGFLICMALSKLSKLDRSREEAVQLTKEILEKQGIVWDSIKDKLTEQMRPTSSSGDAASLQHLADLATAHQGVAATSDDNAPGPSLAQGYMPVA